MKVRLCFVLFSVLVFLLSSCEGDTLPSIQSKTLALRSARKIMSGTQPHKAISCGGPSSTRKSFSQKNIMRSKRFTGLKKDVSARRKKALLERRDRFLKRMQTRFSARTKSEKYKQLLQKRAIYLKRLKEMVFLHRKDPQRLKKLARELKQQVLKN